LVNEKIHKTVANFLLIILIISLLLTFSSLISCYVAGGCFGKRQLTVDKVEPSLNCLEFEENSCQGDLTVHNNCDKEIFLIGVVNGGEGAFKEMYLNETFRNNPYFEEMYLKQITLNIPPHSGRDVESILSLVLENQSTSSKGDEVKWNITAIYSGQNYTIYGILKPNDEGFDLCPMLNILCIISLVFLIITPGYWMDYNKKIRKYEQTIQKNLNIYCKGCGRSIDSTYKLCPYCGKTLKDNKEDY